MNGVMLILLYISKLSITYLMIRIVYLNFVLCYLDIFSGDNANNGTLF